MIDPRIIMQAVEEAKRRQAFQQARELYAGAAGNPDGSGAYSPMPPGSVPGATTPQAYDDLQNTLGQGHVFPDRAGENLAAVHSGKNMQTATYTPNEQGGSAYGQARTTSWRDYVNTASDSAYSRMRQGQAKKNKK